MKPPPMCVEGKNCGCKFSCRLFLFCFFVQSSSGVLSPGFLGDGDVVTQAIHDAKLLLRSHSTGGREREREKDRDGGGKMVSYCSQSRLY